jgi:hypothetical protein
MNKYVLLGIFVLIFIVGLAVIFTNEHVSFSEVMGSLSDLNPRVLSMLALPLIVILFVLGVYLRRKSEERMWKKALLETRTKKQR